MASMSRAGTIWTINPPRVIIMACSAAARAPFVFPREAVEKGIAIRRFSQILRVPYPRSFLLDGDQPGFSQPVAALLQAARL